MNNGERNTELPKLAETDRMDDLLRWRRLGGGFEVEN